MYSLIKYIKPINNSKPLSFEEMDVAYGYVLYRTILSASQFAANSLMLTKFHDRATVLVDLVSLNDTRLVFRDHKDITFITSFDCMNLYSSENIS